MLQRADDCRALGSRQIAALHGRLFRVGDAGAEDRTHAELISWWARPQRVVSGEREHVYGVQRLVPGEGRDLHVACVRHYDDINHGMTKRQEDISERFEHQAEVYVDSITDIKKAERGDNFLIEWPSKG